MHWFWDLIERPYKWLMWSLITRLSSVAKTWKGICSHSPNSNHLFCVFSMIYCIQICLHLDVGMLWKSFPIFFNINKFWHAKYDKCKTCKISSPITQPSPTYISNVQKRCRADFQANLEKSFGELDEVSKSHNFFPPALSFLANFGPKLHSRNKKRTHKAQKWGAELLKKGTQWAADVMCSSGRAKLGDWRNCWFCSGDCELQNQDQGHWEQGDDDKDDNGDGAYDDETSSGDGHGHDGVGLLEVGLPDIYPEEPWKVTLYLH